MEKVKVSQKVADAIEKAKSTFLLSAFVDFANEKSISRNNYNLILRRELDKETLIQAIFYGYEIDYPEFKVGEWVGVNWINSPGITKFYRVKSVLKDEVTIDSKLHGFNVAPLNIVRHATKEEIFWAELGREVGEFRNDDLLIDKENQVWKVDTSRKNAVSSSGMYFKGELKGFYLPESFKPFPKDDDS